MRKISLIFSSLLVTLSSLSVAEETVPVAIPVSKEEVEAIREGRIIPSHISDQSFLDACLEAKNDFDLSKAYPSSIKDDQGNIGTCAGYAAVNALELSWWRYNQSYQLSQNKFAPSNNVLTSFLTEPIFYEVKNEEFKRHSGLLDQAIMNDLSELNEGAFTDKFTLLMVELLKSGKIRPMEHKSAHANVCQNNSHTLLKNIELKLNQADQSPEGAPIRKMLNSGEATTIETEKYLNIKIENKTLRSLIHEEYARYIAETTKGLKPLTFAPGYFDQLGAYRVKLPQNQTPPEKCDPEKLKTTFLRYLCSGIPIIIGAEVSFQNEKIAIDPKAKENFGHGMMLSGYKAARPPNPFKFTLKNSHLNQQSLDVTPEDLCLSHDEASLIINKGYSTKARTSDFRPMKEFNPETMYPLEEGTYVNGIPEWLPDTAAIDLPAVRKRPPNKKH